MKPSKFLLNSYTLYLKLLYPVFPEDFSSWRLGVRVIDHPVFLNTLVCNASLKPQNIDFNFNVQLFFHIFTDGQLSPINFRIEWVHFIFVFCTIHCYIIAVRLKEKYLTANLFLNLSFLNLCLKLRWLAFESLISPKPIVGTN